MNGAASRPAGQAGQVSNLRAPSVHPPSLTPPCPPERAGHGRGEGRPTSAFSSGACCPGQGMDTRGSSGHGQLTSSWCWKSRPSRAFSASRTSTSARCCRRASACPCLRWSSCRGPKPQGSGAQPAPTAPSTPSAQRAGSATFALRSKGPHSWRAIPSSPSTCSAPPASLLAMKAGGPDQYDRDAPHPPPASP